MEDLAENVSRIIYLIKKIDMSNRKFRYFNVKIGTVMKICILFCKIYDRCIFMPRKARVDAL